MLNTEGQRKTVASGLRDFLGCEVVRTNQTSKMPKMPFLGYNITTLSTENKGTYGQYEDGTLRNPVKQIFSFTAQAENYTEAVELANKAHDYLVYIGTQFLNDNDVIVESVGNITDRSNLLTSDYIFSYGFDCFFWLYDEIKNDLPDFGEIKEYEIKEI